MNQCSLPIWYQQDMYRRDGSVISTYVRLESVVVVAVVSSLGLYEAERDGRYGGSGFDGLCTGCKSKPMSCS